MLVYFVLSFSVLNDFCRAKYLGNQIKIIYYSPARWDVGGGGGGVEIFMPLWTDFLRGSK